MLMPAAVVPTFTEPQTALGRREGLRQGGDQAFPGLRPALLDQGGEPSDQVDPHRRGDLVERARDGHQPLGRMPRGDLRDRD